MQDDGFISPWKAFGDAGAGGKMGVIIFRMSTQRWPLPLCDFLSHTWNMRHMQMSLKVIIIKTKWLKWDFSEHSCIWHISVTFTVYFIVYFLICFEGYLHVGIVMSQSQSWCKIMQLSLQAEGYFAIPLQFITIHLHCMGIQFICSKPYF